MRSLLNDPVRSTQFLGVRALRGKLEDAARVREITDHATDQPPGQMPKGAYALARGNTQRRQSTTKRGRPS